MASNSANMSGIQMRWEEQGEGPAVVFVHGIPTGPRLWCRVLPRIRGARTLAWEMVGYGESIPQGEGRDLSVARQAEYLAAWVEHLGIGPVVAVGHDLGGGVVQNLAVRHRDLVRGLVLTNSISHDSWPIPMVRALRALGGVVERLPDAALRLILYPLMFLGHGRPGQAREGLAVHLPPYLRHGGTAALIRQVRSLDVRDTLSIADQLPALDLPVRLVWGAADSFLKIGYGYRLAYELRASLDRIEHGRHFVPEDHPERVAAAVNDLLAELDGPRA